MAPRAALTVALLSVLGALTWRQCRVYRDAETLWRDTLAKNPSAWLAHTNLANIVIRGGDRSKLSVAETHYDEALRLNPRFAQAHVGKGTVLGMRGQLDEAIRHFQEAVRLKPNLAEAYSNLGLAYLQRGQGEEAMTHLERAVELSPGNALLQRNLALGLKASGQIEQAIEAFREALRHAPESRAQIHFELGELLRQQGRIEEAAAEYREAVRADPSHARSRQALDALGRTANP